MKQAFHSKHCASYFTSSFIEYYYSPGDLPILEVSTCKQQSSLHTEYLEVSASCVLVCVCLSVCVCVLCVCVGGCVWLKCEQMFSMVFFSIVKSVCFQHKTVIVIFQSWFGKR